VTSAGGALGVLLALWATDALHALPLPRAAEISVDGRVLALAAGATLLTTLLSSIGPALRVSRAQPLDALKSGSNRLTHRSRARDAMVVAQIALSLTLLVGAALLARSFLKLLQVDPGFVTDNVLTLSLRPTGNTARAVAVYDEVVARVSALPGVTAAGTISTLPLTDANTSLNVFPVGPAALPPGESAQADWRLVDGDYFGALRIPVLRGQTFAGLPVDQAVRSIVISASLARTLFGDADPLGREIRPGSGENKLTVIGVVGDVRNHQLGGAPAPTFYWSLQRFTYGRQKLVVRHTGEFAPLVAAIRETVKSIDPTVPLGQIRTLNQLRATSLEQERLLLGLLGGFAAVALFLAALGTYGVIAFMVQQRTREIGIRLAVGAQPADILHLVVGEGARILVIGGTLGLLGSLAVSRVLASILYETSAHDLAGYAIAALTLTATTLLACWLPARRATKVDPMVALRAE
jgi:putative ABC transport system permease protein